MRLADGETTIEEKLAQSVTAMNMKCPYAPPAGRLGQLPVKNEAALRCESRYAWACGILWQRAAEFF